MDAPDTSPVPNYLDMLHLKRKVFLVFGAGQGIGRQAAHTLAQAGASVVCVGRSKEPTELVAGKSFLAAENPP